MTIIREGRSGEDVKRLSIMFGLTPRITCDKELVEANKNLNDINLSFFLFSL